MNALIPRLLNLVVQIQQVPAPTFHEEARAQFIRGLFQAEGLSGVKIDPAGNVYACLPGDPSADASRSPLVISAHLDTVFPPGTDLSARREAGRLYGPGIGDNALGLGTLFGLLWMLRQRSIRLPFDLWLVANTGEEGLGDLGGMKAVVDRFGESALAYLVLEGMPLGHVFHRGLGVRRYRITVQTPGGHSWVDYGRPSAIHELTVLSSHLLRLDIPRTPRSSLNIGTISGGTSVNTIAARASLELDLRSENPAALQAIAMQVEELCKQAVRPGIEIQAEIIGSRPAGELPADHPLVTLASDSLRAKGLTPVLSIGSTDANLPLSRGLPAVTLGLTTGSGAHTVYEYINIEPLEKGLEVITRLVGRLGE
jgi:tripeptide aminopeptidase